MLNSGRMPVFVGLWAFVVVGCSSGSSTAPDSGIGSGGTAGSAGTAGHAGASGSAGAGGVGGVAGTAGTAGAVGTGTAGNAGGTGGAGRGGGSGSLRATLSQALPASITAPIGALVAIDASDTAVVVSPTNGSTIGDPGPTITWFPASGASHTRSYPNAVTPAAMAIDRTGAIWLVGQLYRSVSFGGTTLQPLTNGYYLVKLASDGTPMAAVAVPRIDVTFATTMTTDADNDVYVAGGVLLTSGTLGSEAFVTKFSPSGSQLYDQTFVGTDTEAQVQGIAIGPNGDVVVAGFFNATMTVGSARLQSLAGLAGNGFVATLDPATGAPRSAFSFGGAVFDQATSVQVTRAGNLRIAGNLSGQSAIGGMTVQADPDSSAFIAELTAAGTARSVELVGGSATSGALFQTTINAADLGFAVGHLNGASATDAIVVQVTPDGQVSLPVRVANSDGNGATGCAADHHGGVWVTGEFMGTIDLGTGPITGADATLPTNFVVHLEP
jgi:hypothetical protein